MDVGEQVVESVINLQLTNPYSLQEVPRGNSAPHHNARAPVRTLLLFNRIRLPTSYEINVRILFLHMRTFFTHYQALRIAAFD